MIVPNTRAKPAILAPQPRISVSPETVTAVAVAFTICWYLRLLTAGGELFEPVSFGHTFNSMLLHLLQGRFDVDPGVVGTEGYVRDGLTYAYFGIFPALFRGLFLPLPDFAHIDFTRLSCLFAVALMAVFKAYSVLVIWREASDQSRPLLFAMMLAGTRSINQG